MQSRTTTVSLIALCAVLAGVLFWRTHSNAEKKSLEERVAALSQELAAAKKQPRELQPVVPREQAPIAAPRLLPEKDQHAAIVPKTSEDLAAARARVSELESKVLSLEADRATLTQQRQQELSAREESCTSRIADVQRLVETAQADLKAAQQRTALFETENENLRKAQLSLTKTNTKTGAVADSDLDELSRRRDTYLKSLMRRYREIDNEYRALLRDPQGAHTNDAAVFRIQGTLAQAEDDLRQIDSLNAKTLLVEKRREKN
jgi:hypothetical protein